MPSRAKKSKAAAPPAELLDVPAEGQTEQPKELPAPTWQLTGLRVTEALKGVSVGPRPLHSFDPLDPGWRTVEVRIPEGPFDPREMVVLYDTVTRQFYRFNTSQVSTVWKEKAEQ